MKHAALLAIVATLVLVSASPSRAAEGAPRTTSHDPPKVLFGINPLSLFLQRASFDVAVLPTKYFALVASAHYVSTSAARNDYLETPTTHFRGGGEEVGARYYFGWHRAEGGFASVALMHGRYGSLSESDAACCYRPGSRYTSALGVAIDAGVTLVARPVFITFGLGLQYVVLGPPGGFGPTDELGVSVNDIVYGSGLRPRFLLTVGFGG